MKSKWRRCTIILVVLTLISGGIMAYLYSKKGLVSVKKETVEEEKSYENHSITRIINKTIVTDIESVRKDIVFQFRKGAPSADIDYVASELKKEFKDKNTSIVTEKQEGTKTIRWTVYNESEKKLNSSLKTLLGENNNIQYKYTVESKYKGNSVFMENSDISRMLDYFKYTGDTGYEVYGYRDEILGNVKLNNQKVQVDSSYYRAEGEKLLTIEFNGSYENYWFIAKQAEHVIFGILCIILIIVLFRREKYLMQAQMN